MSPHFDGFERGLVPRACGSPEPAAVSRDESLAGRLVVPDDIPDQRRSRRGLVYPVAVVSPAQGLSRTHLIRSGENRDQNPELALSQHILKDRIGPGGELEWDGDVMPGISLRK